MIGAKFLIWKMRRRQIMIRGMPWFVIFRRTVIGCQKKLSGNMSPAEETGLPGHNMILQKVTHLIRWAGINETLTLFFLTMGWVVIELTK